jgi:hypothetical protein
MIIITINQKVELKEDAPCITIGRGMISNAKIKKSRTDKLLVWHRMIFNESIHLSFSIDKFCPEFRTCEFYLIVISEKDKYLNSYCFYDLDRDLQGLIFERIKTHLEEKYKERQ